MKLQWVVHYRLTHFLKEITAKRPADFKAVKEVIDTILKEQDGSKEQADSIKQAGIIQNAIQKLKRENNDVRQVNLASVLLLGFCHFYGIGVDVDKAAGFTYFKRATEKDYTFAAAQWFMGECYLNGEGVAQDEKTAVEKFRLAAAAGQNSYGNYFLGRAFHAGKDGRKDEVRGIELLEKAVKQRNAEAQYFFAMMNFELLNESSSVDNILFVFECLNEAAVQGHPEAIKKLAEMIANFQQQAASSDLKNLKVLHCLAQLYQEGVTGLPRNDEIACKYLQRLVDKGDAEASYLLGRCYSEGRGVRRNEKTAAELYLLASSRGNANAQHIIGLCRLDGTWVEEDRKEAVECFKKAAAQKHGGACVLLAWCYTRGVAVAKDDTQVFENYRLAVAADSKDLESKCNLGQCYEKGIGTKVDKQEARRLYAEAACGGRQEGSDLLSRLKL